MSAGVIGAGRAAREATDSIKQEAHKAADAMKYEGNQAGDTGMQKGREGESALQRVGSAVEEGFAAAVQAPRHLAESVRQQVSCSLTQSTVGKCISGRLTALT